MKKMTLKLTALAILVCNLFLLSSCGLFVKKPNFDLADAEDNLKDEDYSVVYLDDEDSLGIGIVEMLRASKDDDMVYVCVYEKQKLADLAYEEYKLQYEAEVDSYELQIKEYKYMIKAYADELEDKDGSGDYDNMLEQYEEKLEDLEEELEELKENYVFGKKGKTVWYGTKDAIDATKG